MVSTTRRDTLVNLSILLLGQVTGSTAVLAIKLSTLHPTLLAALRLSVAALTLFPLYLRDSRREGRRARDMLTHALPSLLPGLFLALHFISWNYGARLTLAANANLIVNMMPVAMPFMVFFMYGTRIRRRALFGTTVAMAGVFLLTGSKLRFEAATLMGDLICILSMLVFTLYIAFAGDKSRHKTLWLYMVPLFGIGGLISLLFSVPLVLHDGLWVGSVPPQGKALLVEWLYPLYLGLIPTVIGHTIYNRSMKVLPSQMVSVGMLTQFIFSGFFAYLLFGEIPSLFFFPAALLVLAGTLIIVLKHE